MKKRILVSGLLLTVGGWVSDLCAQGGPGMGLPSLAPVSLTKTELVPCPAVTLGRPIAIRPTAVKREPAATGIVPAAYQVPMGEYPGAMPVVPPFPAPREGLPAWPDDEEADEQAPQPSGFASDRPEKKVVLAKSVSIAPLVLLPPVATIASSVPKVVQVKHQPEMLPPVPTTKAPPPPARLPEAFASSGHDFWSPESDADPLRPHFYAAAEYLSWWTKADHVPALVTTGDPNNVNANGRFGFLGQSSTQTLFGDGSINGGPRSGVRITAGYWLDMFQEEGVEISGFVLGQKSNHFNASSADFPVLARPFFNLNTNSEFSELVAFPGLSTGRVSVDNRSNLWGIEANQRCNLLCCCDRRIDLFGGFRYLDLDESINIVEDINGLGTAPAPFTNQRALVFDRFATHNSFYGGQLGLDSEFRRGRWFLDVKGKLGIGVTDSKVTIDGGQTFVNADGTRRQVQGGLLALSSNIGKYHKDHFSFVPEVGMNLGYQVNDNIRVFGGYNVLYWTGVLRPGDQIDRALDVTRIPNFPVAGTALGGEPRPAPTFKASDFWAHGITVGVEFRY